MTPERWQQVKAIFEAAMEHPTEDRAAFLDRSCGKDAALHREVMSLLASHDAAPDFLKAPVTASKPATMRPTATLIGSQVGDYQLVEFIGAGGMGEVYRAVHVQLGRPVAVKVLHKTRSNRKFVERFRNEARIQSRLRHPNIVTLYDYVEHAGRLCIFMEYVDGESLNARIHQAGRMPVPEALAIFRKVVEALDYVHQQGVVHRDVKPHNIKLSRRGEVKLLDFGIAKHETSPGLTDTGAVVGTPEYLSPEQLRGKPADARTDVWALGVLLYEMLTGHIPFEAPSLIELYKKIDEAAYTRPSSLAPEVTPELEAIITRCLQRRPASRYQTASDVLRDVRNVGVGKALRLRRPAFPTLPRLPRLRLPDTSRLLPVLRRHAPFYLLGAATLVLVLVLLQTGPRSVTRPAAPVLVQPAQQATDVPTRMTFTWERVAGAARYHLQLADSRLFSSLITEHANLTGTSFTVSGLRPGEAYYVRVRAVNQGGTSAWSTARRFRTVAEAPSAEQEDRRNIVIDIFAGKAEVWRDGTLLGVTPHPLDVRVGERVELLLKQEGYHDKPLAFDVTAAMTGFTETMEPKR